MKVHLTSDEVYPVWSVEATEFGVEIEVGEERLNDWTEATQAFGRAQKEMKLAVEEASTCKRVRTQGKDRDL